MMQGNLTWNKGMQFSCDNHGIKSMMDATPEHGGEGLAPTPKELVLNAMMGCTAMDVVSMLKKMRQGIQGYKMHVEAEKTAHHPVHFKRATLTFEVDGAVEPEKLIKAVDASLTKYCGVNYIVSKTCRIHFRVLLNGGLIKEGPVQFIEPPAEE